MLDSYAHIWDMKLKQVCFVSKYHQGHLVDDIYAETLHHFQFASNGNEEEVEKLLSSGGEPGSPGEKFCHPLCSCDKCETLHTR